MVGPVLVRPERVPSGKTLWPISFGATAAGSAMRARRTTPEFGAWRAILKRGPLCRRWRCYVNFWRDLGPRPTWMHLVIRDDPTGEFSPTNCRWRAGRWYQRPRAR
jgi:hypothetical protein